MSIRELTPESIIANFVAQFVFEGLRYLVTRMRKRKYYAKTFRKCLEDSAANLKRKFPNEASLLTKRELHEKLLISPKS